MTVIYKKNCFSDCIPKSKCKPVQNYTSLEPGQKVVIDSTGCCPTSKVICDKSTCPPKPLNCVEEFYMVEKIPSKPDECCEKFKCVPPGTHCIATIGGKKVLKKVDEIWSSGDPCLIEQCRFDTNGDPVVKSKKETCNNVCQLVSLTKFSFGNFH